MNMLFINWLILLRFLYPQVTPAAINISVHSEFGHHYKIADSRFNALYSGQGAVLDRPVTECHLGKIDSFTARTGQWQRATSFMPTVAKNDFIHGLTANKSSLEQFHRLFSLSRWWSGGLRPCGQAQDGAVLPGVMRFKTLAPGEDVHRCQWTAPLLPTLLINKRHEGAGDN